jgi:hypothetical protein
MIVTVPIKCSTVKKIGTVSYHLLFWFIVCASIFLAGVLIYAAPLPGTSAIQVAVILMSIGALVILSYLFCPYEFQCMSE